MICFYYRIDIDIFQFVIETTSVLEGFQSHFASPMQLGSSQIRIQLYYWKLHELSRQVWIEMHKCICLRICNTNETNHNQDREDSHSQCNDCSICLDSLQSDVEVNNNEIIKLKCGHSYHQQCIQDWRRGSMEASRKRPSCWASFGENEVNPKQQPVQQNHNQCMSMEDTCVVSCMGKSFRFLTGLMVILVNFAWIFPMMTASIGWIILMLLAVPGDWFYRAYWVKDEQDLCCSECKKGHLLFFSFLFTATPCAFYAYIVYLSSYSYRYWHNHEILFHSIHWHHPFNSMRIAQHSTTHWW